MLGIIGEESNLLMCYLVATSRLLKNPLSAVITSQAGSGKSLVAELVMKFIPDDQKVDLERITPTVLYYQPEDRMKHKVLSIEEEQGAQGADYSLRCLMSKGRVRLALTGRDPQTGEFVAQERECKGPIALLSTTTTQSLDPETRLRMFCLATNESEEHSYNIVLGQWDEDDPELAWREALCERIQNKHHLAQNKLKSIRVYNPYTKMIKKIIKREVYLRTRRDNKKYRYLMNTIALLHQHQKERHWLKPLPDLPAREYILVSLEDIELANKLVQEIMPKTLDELSPSARNLLIEICKKVRTEAGKLGKEVTEYRFTRRDIREWTKWSDFQIGYYIKELERLEYVNPLRGGQGAQYEYELLFDGDPEQSKYVPGLIDINRLKEEVHNNNSSGGFIEKVTRFFNQKGQLLEPEGELLEAK
jgi:hypothetical protein